MTVAGGVTFSDGVVGAGGEGGVGGVAVVVVVLVLVVVLASGAAGITSLGGWITTPSDLYMAIKAFSNWSSYLSAAFSASWVLPAEAIASNSICLILARSVST
jgi:hypothetical protein